MSSRFLSPKLLAWIQVHVAVFLFGFTGILGDLIDLPSFTLVWWRMLITALSLLFFPRVISDLRGMSMGQLLKLAGIGGIVAAHWVLFFASIKLTGPTVALTCLATAPFFTAIVEPLIMRQKVQWYQLGLGLMIIPGVFIIQQSDGVHFGGMLLGFASALGAAIFSVLNKTQVDDHRPVTMTAVELGAGALILSLIVPFEQLVWQPESTFFPVGWDWAFLLILALLCTSFAYLITLNALRQLPAFSINLSINLEPVYTIFLAAWLLNENEELQNSVYWGAAIIIVSVFLNVIIGWLKGRKEQKEQEN